MKRKCQSSSNTTSSNSDEDRPKGSNNMELSEGVAPLQLIPWKDTRHLLSLHHTKLWPFKSFTLSQTLQWQYLVSTSSSLFSLAEPALLKDQSASSTLDDQDKKSSDAATAVVGTSLPLPVPNKPESVVSITSQCSYSSTIVHVGDKKPQPESGTVLWKKYLPQEWCHLLLHIYHTEVSDLQT